MSSIRSILERIFTRVDSSTLGIFRIVWGVVMVLEAHWLWKQNVDLHSPDFVHFYFQGFSWIQHFPEGWMTQLETAVLMLAGILVTVGFAYRLAVFIYFLGYVHLFFAEAAAYNNHFYLMCLVSGLLIFIRADSAFSLRRKFGKVPLGSIEPIPMWNYLILRFQVFVVYFYGAIAKINYDWLVEMEPIRFWLQNGEHIPKLLAPIVSQEWFVYIAAWGGLVIDLACPFLLLFKRTRLLGILILISFHLLNSQLFRIGFFPFMGISLILVFFPPNFFRRKKETKTIGFGKGSPRKCVLIPLLVYCLFQILFPLRWHLYSPGNPSWTDAGHRFAWRMMLRERLTTVKIYFGDPRVDPWLDARPRMLPMIAPSARIRAMEYPLFIWQYTQHVRERLALYGFADTPIYIHATSSLSGRPFYPVIDPNADMAQATAPVIGTPDWLLPLPEDLPIDFNKIDLESDGSVQAQEALRKYFEENPGPGEKFLPHAASSLIEKQQ